MIDDYDELKPEEPLAASMPDPSGSPKPVPKNDPGLKALGVAGVLLVAAGGIMIPLAATTTCTAGAMRSTKLQWQQRDAQIRQAMADEQLPSATAQPESQAGDHESSIDQRK